MMIVWLSVIGIVCAVTSLFNVFAGMLFAVAAPFAGAMVYAIYTKPVPPPPMKSFDDEEEWDGM